MYEERIWRFLKGKLLSDCGAAGLMGNLYAESGLNPVNLQNTHERKLGLSDKEYTQQVDFGLYADFVHDGAVTALPSGPSGAGSRTCWPLPKAGRRASAIWRRSWSSCGRS